MKRILTYITLVVLLLSGSVTLYAAVRTAEQAQQIAIQQFSNRNIRRAASKQNKWQTKVVFNALNQDKQPYLYAVNLSNEEGFVLVSGDDRFAPVLGYGLSSFDEQNMPDNMRAWLQGYIEEIKFLDRIGYQPSLTTQNSTSAAKQSITPRVTTKWGQGTPYNNFCPLDKSNKRSVTGCVATAMAQTVNYHMQHYNAPTAILAEIPGYVTETDSLVVDTIPGNTPLPDKSLLLNTYTSSPTDAQKEAVAQLMLYCGTSVEMDYTSSSSGAVTRNVANSLITYFGFDKTVQPLDRYNFTYAAWIDTIYSELAQSRPVILSGHSSGGGHAFVTDGFDSETNLFHINWGWTGNDDGYFALSVLNPDDNSQIGASSSSDGYSIDQLAIVGIQIGSGQTPTPQPVSMTMDLLSVRNDTVYFSARNNTGQTRSFQFGIGWIDDEGTITRIGSSSTATNLKNNYGWGSRYKVVPQNTDYANTTKIIVPISRETGTLTWYPGGNVDLHYVVAKYDAEGNPTLTLYPASNLQSGGITINSSKYVNEVQTVKLALNNTGDEFYGVLYFFADTTEAMGKYVSELGLTVLEQGQTTASFEWTPTKTGTYTLRIATDSKGRDVIATSTVTIKEDASLAGKTVAVVGLAYNGQDNDSWQFDEVTGTRIVNIYCDTLAGTVSIKNFGTKDIENYKVKVFYELYDEQTGTYTTKATSSYSNLGTLVAGKTRNLGTSRKIEPDNTYRIRVRRMNPTPEEDIDIRYYFRLIPKPVPPDPPIPPDPPTGIDQWSNNQWSNSKILKDGQLLILRDGKAYSILGLPLSIY